MKRRERNEKAKTRALTVSIRCFLKQGYRSTQVKDLEREMGINQGTFRSLYEGKEGVLAEITPILFHSLQEAMAPFKEETDSPIQAYALEMSILLALVEKNEALREILVEMYSLLRTTDYICEQMAPQLKRTFGIYLPELQMHDFFEMGIGTTGILRNYMARNCHPYLPLAKKQKLFLSITLCCFKVPKREIRNTIKFIANTDFDMITEKVTQRFYQLLQEEMDADLSSNEA